MPFSVFTKGDALKERLSVGMEIWGRAVCIFALFYYYYLFFFFYTFSSPPLNVPPVFFSGSNSYVEFYVQKDHEFFIMVHSYGAALGDFELDVSVLKKFVENF